MGSKVASTSINTLTLCFLSLILLVNTLLGQQSTYPGDTQLLSSGQTMIGSPQFVLCLKLSPVCPGLICFISTLRVSQIPFPSQILSHYRTRGKKREQSSKIQFVTLSKFCLWENSQLVPWTWVATGIQPKHPISWLRLASGTHHCSAISTHIPGISKLVMLRNISSQEE